MASKGAVKPAESSGAGGLGSDVPDVVRNFLTTFARRLRQRNVHEIQSLYSTDFPRLSERYYKNSAWPNAEVVAELIDKDENFLVLYKELYYRHMYLRLAASITVEDRFDSFQNYADVFNIILGLKPDAPEIELPVQWLFDLIDEFVFQYSAFHTWRSQPAKLSDSDVKFLREEDPHTWSAPTVLRYLTALVKKANLSAVGTAPAAAAAAAPTPGAAATPSAAGDKKADAGVNVATFFKALAHFAIIGLCRVNCLLGDYTTALKVLDPIDLNSKRSFFSQVGGAYVSLYYYLTLSYVMTSRYTDAVKASSGLLLWASRNTHDVPRSSSKRIEQVYGLLAMATALNPQRLSDQLSTAVRERFGDKFQRMQKCDVGAFEEVFLMAAPKYIDPATPAYLMPGSTGPVPTTPSAATTPAAAAGAGAKKAGDTKKDEKTKPDHKSGPGAAEHSKDKSAAASVVASDDTATRTQLRIFLRDVRQRASIPDNVSYLKLCTSITLSKLASFLKSTAAARAAAQAQAQAQTATGTGTGSSGGAGAATPSASNAAAAAAAAAALITPTAADESAAACGLLNLKMKTRALRWRGGAPASGTVASSAELDVAIAKDVVHISEYKAARRYGEYFIRQILQLSRLCDDIGQIQTA